MRAAAAIAVCLALAAPACCRPCNPRPSCSPPPPTPPTAFFNDGGDADVRGGRPENVFRAPDPSATVHDVRDLEARPGFDRDVAVRALREAAPSAAIQWTEGRIVATGPDLSQTALVAWLVRTRAGTPIERPLALERPAVRLRYFDVCDLVGTLPPEVTLAPSSTTFEPDAEPDAEAPAPSEWPVLIDLRALAPGTEIQRKSSILIARGPADERTAIARHLDGLRAATPPAK